MLIFVLNLASVTKHFKYQNELMITFSTNVTQNIIMYDST